MNQREQIIANYINSYNQFDISGMVSDFDPSIRFENISNGILTMALEGLKQFVDQAEQAKNLFSERKQTVKAFHHLEDQVTVDIDYHAVLAVDLPNGLKKGEALSLKGQSIFKFSGDRITALSDIS